MRGHNRWLGLLITVFVLSAVRMLWCVSNSATGSQPHIELWRATTVGQFTSPTPLEDQDPADQANFWLSELDGIVEATDDPDDAIGVAWMLDAPQSGFKKRHLRVTGSASGFPTPEIDQDAIDSLLAEFHELTNTRCLAAINRATELRPENPDVWRDRALLLFAPTIDLDEATPRDPDWLQKLDDCANHDPENALYGYLAALALWSLSAEQGWDETVKEILYTVQDEDGFEDGSARFNLSLIHI